MQKITGKPYEIPSFSQHLNDFCETKKGRILLRTGTKRKFRFRFRAPPHAAICDYARPS